MACVHWIEDHEDIAGHMSGHTCTGIFSAHRKRGHKGIHKFGRKLVATFTTTGEVLVARYSILVASATVLVAILNSAIIGN